MPYIKSMLSAKKRDVCRRKRKKEKDKTRYKENSKKRLKDNLGLQILHLLSLEKSERKQKKSTVLRFRLFKLLQTSLEATNSLNGALY